MDTFSAILIIFTIIIVGTVISTIVKEIVKSVKLIPSETFRHNQRVWSKTPAVVIKKIRGRNMSQFYFMEDRIEEHIQKMLSNFCSENFSEEFINENKAYFVERIVDNSYIVISNLNVMGFNYSPSGDISSPTKWYYEFQDKRFIDWTFEYFNDRNMRNFVTIGYDFPTKGEYRVHGGKPDGYLVIPLSYMVNIMQWHRIL